MLNTVMPNSIIFSLKSRKIDYATRPIIDSGDYHEVLLTERWIRQLGFKKVITGGVYFYTKELMGIYRMYSNLSVDADEGWYLQGANEGDCLRLYSVSDFQSYLRTLFGHFPFICLTPEIASQSNPIAILRYNDLGGVFVDMNPLMYAHFSRVERIHVRFDMKWSELQMKDEQYVDTPEEFKLLKNKGILKINVTSPIGLHFDIDYRDLGNETMMMSVFNYRTPYSKNNVDDFINHNDSQRRIAIQGTRFGEGGTQPS